MCLLLAERKFRIMARYVPYGSQVMYTGFHSPQPAGTYTPAQMAAQMPPHRSLPSQLASVTGQSQGFQPLLQRQSSSQPSISRRISSQQLMRQGWQNVQSMVGNAVSTFLCPICLENVRTDQRVVFRNCGRDDHGCCAECTGFFIKGLVEDGRVSNITCGQRGGTDCTASASGDEVKQLVDDETYQKYVRFTTMRDDPNARECPNCSILNKPVIDASGEIQAEMTCSSCGAEYCYYHSNACGGRCDEYRRKISKQEREMADGVMADSKPCPKCGIMTSKVSGCNHMTCTERTCRCDWCWVCGQEIEGGANGVMEHYRRGNCRQFTDLEVTPGPLYTCLQIALCPVKLLFQLVFLLLTILLFTLLPIMFIVAGPCLRCNPTAVKTLTFILAYSLYVFLAIFWMFFTLLFFLCCCVPCGADHSHLLFLMIFPFMAIERFRPLMRCFFGDADLDDLQDDSDDEEDEEEGEMQHMGE